MEGNVKQNTLYQSYNNSSYFLANFQEKLDK